MAVINESIIIKTKLVTKRVFTYLMLIFICAWMVLPFFWMLITSLKPMEEVFGTIFRAIWDFSLT